MTGFGLSPYGLGSFGTFEGIFLPQDFIGLGYGGIPYGQGPYGGVSFIGATLAVTGGYGGAPYGFGSYGSIDSLATKTIVTGVVSIDGFTLEIFFSNEMLENATLFDPTSYFLTDIFGAAPSAAVSVQAGVQGQFGPTSVLVSHSGTTLGGIYEVEVVGPKDIGGTAVEAYAPLNKAQVLCKGEPPPYSVTPISGDQLLFVFDFPMLTEAQFSPGIEQLDAYEFTTDYPQTIIPTGITHPYLGDASQLLMDVIGMTSTDYTSLIGPANAIIFDASTLPTADTSFLSQEIGVGTTEIGPNGLLMSVETGFVYGWRFADTTGKIQPQSSYRFDITIDFSAVETPFFEGQMALIYVSDGAVQVSIRLERLLGVDQVVIESGAFQVTQVLSWSTQETVISLVRNQRADTFTFVLDGEPQISALTASFTGNPSIAPGCQLLLNPQGTFTVENFGFNGINFTSSQTVFSAAWNFLHNALSPFFGNNALTKGFILTQKGPLVKGWGDATPATKQDVVVKINGIEIEVESVNPYIGKIIPTIPIPLVPPGTMTVEVDYIWFPNPIVEFLGLNTEGLTLNSVACKARCPNSQSQGQLNGGGFNLNKFEYGVVLAPQEPRKPLLRSPRFVAFEKAYTAAINSPTTFLLNQNPHTVALPDEEKSPEGLTVFYEGTEDPDEAEPPWTLVGEQGVLEGGEEDSTVVEEPDINQEFFTVLDLSSGPFSIGEPSFYTQDVDFSFNSTVVFVSRFQLTSTVELETDGVFTGVGFGCSVNNFLYLVGCLLINEVQHIGMLVEPAFPEKQESWQLANGVAIVILDSTTFTCQTEEFPSRVSERLVLGRPVRFQILEGSQAGVYDVVQIVNQSDGTTTVTLSSDTPFPEDPKLWANDKFDAYFEVRWDGDGEDDRPITYRLVVKNDIKELDSGFAELFVGGFLSGAPLQLSGVPAFAIPPDGVLLFPTGEKGQVFWGSLSRRAVSSSDWFFVRYGIEPAQTTIHFRGIVAAAEMNDLPENDPNNIWFKTQEFGFSEIDSTADNLLLKSTSNQQEGVDDIDLTFGYARIEPFLTRYLSIDVDLHFRVESGVLGSQDCLVLVRDGLREVRLSTILYQTTGTSHELITSLQTLSLSGLLEPTLQGWEQTGEISEVRVQGQRLQFTQAVGETIQYDNAFAEPTLNDGRIIEWRFKVENLVSNTSETGISFGTDVGDPAVSVGLKLQLPDQVVLYSPSTATDVQSFTYTWNDGELHTYRILADPDTDTVTLVIDDTVQGTISLALFDLSATDVNVFFGLLDTETSLFLETESISFIEMPPANAQRTLGVWLGTDVDDIDSWELPRIDSFDVPNSSLLADIVEFDWQEYMRVRIHRDPTWGVTILRPDLPPPPFFTGNFATQFTEPSAGWINVEYRDLPRQPTTDVLGLVSFGALDPRSVTQQRWNEVRYRIYKYASEDIIAPHHQVLNQYNVLTSGEFGEDITIETVTVTSENSTTIKLTGAHIYADRVFNFSFVNLAGETVIFNPPSFTFDKETQTITIVSEQNLGYVPSVDVPDLEDEGVINPSLNDQDFPFDPDDEFEPDGFFPQSVVPSLPEPVQVPVTVNFAPGKPLTLTYICSQPLLNGVTLLNEGTPVFNSKFECQEVGIIEWGSQINDPNDTLTQDPDFILNDPYRSRQFTTPDKCQFEDIERCEVSEGEECLLSPFCDEDITGAGGGVVEFNFSGLMFTEQGGLGFQDGPANAFNESFSNTFLKASGADYDEGGELNDALLWTQIGPNSPNNEGIDGQVGWSVIGQLYDTLTNETTILYFNNNP